MLLRKRSQGQALRGVRWAPSEAELARAWLDVEARKLARGASCALGGSAVIPTVSDAAA